MARPMQDILAILNQRIDSPAFRTVLSGVAFEPEVQDFGQDVEPTYWLHGRADGLLVKHEANGRVTTVFFYVLPADGYTAFVGDLVAGLLKHHKRDEVYRRLGAPTKSGSAQVISGLDPQGPWDRYDSPTICLHVQYQYDADCIQRITAMTPEVAP